MKPGWGPGAKLGGAVPLARAKTAIGCAVKIKKLLTHSLADYSINWPSS